MNESLGSEAIMAELNGEVLKKLARTVGVGKGLTRKLDVADAVARYLRGHLPAALALCSDIERAALAEAAHDPGGRVEPSVFFGKHGAGFPTCPDSYHAEEVSPFHALAARDEDGALVVGPDTAAALRGLLPKPEGARARTESALPDAMQGRPIRVYEGARMVFAELRQVLSLVRGGRVRVAPKSGQPTGAAVRLLGETLAVPDFDLDAPQAERTQWCEAPGPVRAFAWGVLVQACGWARAKGTGLELTRAGGDMLTAGSPAAFKTGVQRFLMDDDFDELRRIDNIRGQSGNARRNLVRVSARKGNIVEAVKLWPVGGWVAFDEAARFQLACGAAFDVSRNPWDLYFCEKQYGSLGYAGGEGCLERQFMRAFFLESLGTLGLLDVAYVWPHGLWPEFSGWWGTDDSAYCGRYDGLLYMRLNELGAFCLGAIDRYELPARAVSAVCRILPNLDVAVTAAALSPADACSLGLFAERAGDNLWRISRSAVLAHLDKGGTMDELRQAMQELAEGDIPPNVQVFLDDIERRAGSVRSVEKALLIDCGDAATAGDIASSAGVRAICLRAGETHLVVSERNARTFRAAMKKLGRVLPP